MTTHRQRLRLVPLDGVECFEIRLALFYDQDATSMVAYEVSTPDDPKARPPLHEVLGVLRFAEAYLIDEYEAYGKDSVPR